MTLLSFLCDLVGLVAMCTLAVITAVVYSLLKLLMAGFLRSVLRLSRRGHGMLRHVPLLSLKILEKGNKSWLSLTLGKVTLAAALEKTGSHQKNGVLMVKGDGDTITKEVDS